MKTPLEKARLVLFNKPYGVLSQFTDAEGRATLAAYLDVPGVYPAGRLDRDSEGLLLLTDSGTLQAKLAGAAKARRDRLEKRYLVQVEGTVADARPLRRSINLRDGPARFTRVTLGAQPPPWPRDPPVTATRHPHTSWLEVGLDEGRNRQVRRMLAAFGFPVLRLVRTRIGRFSVAGLAPGAHRIQLLHVAARGT